MPGTKKSLLERDLPDLPYAVGIVSSCKEYTLAWQLDRALQIRLTKQEDITLEFKKGTALLLSHLLYREPFLIYRLIRNRGNETAEHMTWIVPEMRQFDYFLLIENEATEPDMAWHLDEIKACPCVQFSSIVNLDEVKSKENLLF